MLKVVHEIIEAQDALKLKYGDEDYQKMIDKMKSKTDDSAAVLCAIIKDNKISADLRLIAYACLGE